MKTFLLRGAFANQFELQNYEPIVKDFDLQLIASRSPLTKTKIPTINLPSPYDLPYFPLKQAILNRTIGDSHWLLGLEKIIAGADLIHTAETYYAYTHQAVQMRKQGRIGKLISTCWETIPHNNESLPRKKKWKQEARAHIDHFITPTNLAKQALTEEGINPDKISTIHVGVDLKRFKPSRPRKTVKRILFIGRAVEEKGITDLLEIARKLPTEIELQIIGKGNIRIPKRGNIKSIQLPYSSIHKQYQEADIFILPSRTTPTWEEQYGMVLVEAMASGLPIIATSTGAIPEVVDNTAILVPERSPQELHHALTNLINSPTKRKSLGTKARARAEKHFDKNLIAKKISSLYNELL